MSVGVWDGLKKLWLSAAYYGEEDICRELFKHIPAATRSSLPTKPENAMVEELCYEGELTALHLASYSGSENVVRAVLNQPKVEIGIIKKTLPSCTDTPSSGGGGGQEQP